MKIKPLKITKKTINQVDVLDLQKFIKQVYKKGYSIPSGEEWHNDTFHEIEVHKNLLPDDIELFNNWLNDDREYEDHQFILYTIMHDLYKKGHIKTGKYIIHVCW